MRKICAFLLLLIIALSCSKTFPEKDTELEVSFVEVIIKVRPDTIVMPKGTCKAPLSEIEINSRKLKALNRKFNLITLEKAFTGGRSKEELQEEFPERQARAPQDAPVVDLENIYLMKFPEHTSVDAVIEEYEAAKEIIYAEENKTLEIF